jgi:hypothetical protein
MESDRILEEMVRRLVAAFDPDHIYLYGSRARGEAGPDSDYDLMLVVSASQVPRYRRNQQAFRALCGPGSAQRGYCSHQGRVWQGDLFASGHGAPGGRLLYAA